MQRLVDLNRFARFKGGDLGQLKFTIAQFFRINGESTQHRGVVPDIIFPTAIDSQDQGERSLDNALPWASVRPANYSIGGVNKKAVEAARKNHRLRIGEHPGFVYLVGEVEAIKKAREQDKVSLLESERRRTREDNVNSSLERLNRYRRSQGLPELGILEDQRNPASRSPSENTDEDNILRREASWILADVIALSRDERLITLHEQQQKL